MLKNIAIFGATGLVGLELIKILEQRNFELNSLKLFASKKSAGQKLEFKNQELEIFELTEDIFDNFELDLIFCCLSNSLAKKFMPLAQAKNIICIDKSSHFRLDPKVPLVAYEVNKNSIHNNKHRLFKF